MRLVYNKLLQNFTTLRIGGPADIFVEVEEEDKLAKLLYSAYKKGIRWVVLGGGAKVLIPDSGIEGMVIKLAGKLIDYIRVEGTIVSVAAGKSLKNLLATAIKHNLGGLEFLLGMPGTVGGAIKNNAGFNSYSFGNFVNRVKIFDKKGDMFFLDKKDLNFKYRYSELPKECIIVEAELTLQELSEENKLQLRKVREKRLKTQPQLRYYPNCGCIFKNPEGEISAGYLLEKAGLKGKSYRNAGFSEIHANFIINYGGASSEDVLYLINLAKEKVFKEFNISLEEEIIIL